MKAAQSYQQIELARYAAFDDLKIIFAVAVDGARESVNSHAVAGNYFAVSQNNVFKLNRTLHFFRVAKNFRRPRGGNRFKPIAQDAAKRSSGYKRLVLQIFQDVHVTEIFGRFAFAVADQKR